MTPDPDWSAGDEPPRWINDISPIAALVGLLAAFAVFCVIVGGLAVWLLTAPAERAAPPPVKLNQTHKPEVR